MFWEPTERPRAAPAAPRMPVMPHFGAVLSSTARVDSAGWSLTPISSRRGRSGRKRSLRDRRSSGAPSTVRAELAALEADGYLTHPHTSAGRVPTDSGYRRYVDLMLESRPRRRRRPVSSSSSRGCAARSTRRCGRRPPPWPRSPTSSPWRPRRPETVAATIHRVEVLRLRPDSGDGRRDRLQRRGRQARLRLRPRGRPGPRRVGLELPERVARRDERRRADDRRPARRPRAGPRRGRFRRRDRGHLHRARGGARRHALHGRRRAAALRRRASATCRGPTS